MIEAGARLGESGRYVVRARLGEGGMGEVFLADDERLGTPVVIKILSSQFVHHTGVRERFVNEALIQARLRHPHIVRALDTIDDGDVLGIVMDYVDGPSLDGYVRGRGGRLPLAEALHLLVPIADAVHYAHQHGIVHRDIKPGNILLECRSQEAAGSAIVPKVMDFGIAKILTGGPGGRTRVGSVLGTPSYMPPEQLRGEPDIDGRVDVYALGAILYQITTGQPPHDGGSEYEITHKVLSGEQPASPSSTVPGLPHDLDALVECAMAPDPAHRFASAGALREALRALAAALSEAPSAVAHRAIAPSAAPPPTVFEEAKPDIQGADQIGAAQIGAPPGLVADSPAPTASRPGPTQRRQVTRTWIVAALALAAALVAVGWWVLVGSPGRDATSMQFAEDISRAELEPLHADNAEITPIDPAPSRGVTRASAVPKPSFNPVAGAAAVRADTDRPETLTTEGARPRGSSSLRERREEIEIPQEPQKEAAINAARAVEAPASDLPPAGCEAGTALAGDWRFNTVVLGSRTGSGRGVNGYYQASFEAADCGVRGEIRKSGYASHRWSYSDHQVASIRGDVDTLAGVQPMVRMTVSLHKPGGKAGPQMEITLGADGDQLYGWWRYIGAERFQSGFWGSLSGHRGHVEPPRLSTRVEGLPCAVQCAIGCDGGLSNADSAAYAQSATRCWRRCREEPNADAVDCFAR